MIELKSYPNLQSVVTATLQEFPGHVTLARKSFDVRSDVVLSVSEDVSSLIKALSHHVAGGLQTFCRDYRFLCEEIVPPEELFFRRAGHYRLSSFDDANALVYSNGEYMARYMNGLILSDVMWANHAQAMEYYVNTYLPSLSPGSDHLEIGPGHGLFLHFAAANKNVRSATGWDVSPTSIAHTRVALQAFGTTRHVDLELMNLFDAEKTKAAEPRFDSIVMSEILEHLENPVAALKVARRYLKPGGRIWVNVPANSPAPDHLFLVESPEHACSLVEEAGLEIEDSAAFPMTGMTMERARKQKGAISCLVTGRIPS